MVTSFWKKLAAAPVLGAGLIPALIAPAPASATDYYTVAEAQRALLPRADRFVPYAVTLDRSQLKRIKSIAGVQQRTAQPKVWKAMAGGAQIGWVIVDEVIGKHEFITYATALSMDGHVKGVEILSYRESKGGQVRNPKWLALFRGKTMRDPFKLNKDIPNISGATLSSRNITDGVKRLLALQAVALGNAA